MSEISTCRVKYTAAYRPSLAVPSPRRDGNELQSRMSPGKAEVFYPPPLL